MGRAKKFKMIRKIVREGSKGMPPALQKMYYKDAKKTILRKEKDDKAK